MLKNKYKAKLLFIAAIISFQLPCWAQSINKIIRLKEVKRIEKALASDDMEGRKTFEPGIEKAAVFIENEFSKIGLQTFNGSKGFRQTFTMYQSVPKAAEVIFDNVVIPDSMYASFSYQPQFSINELSGIEMIKIGKTDKFFPSFNQLYQSKKNLLVLIDTVFKKQLQRIKARDWYSYDSSGTTVLFVCTAQEPKTFKISLSNDVVKKELSNVVGVLPGKGKLNEVVVFSAHYDHLGLANPSEVVNSDGIYNGANDDAAGTTAMIMLAKYFKKVNNNERTLVFTAFTAEEIGGFGSTYFSKQLDAAAVVAMFNIEMIGTASKWGANSAYITGFEKSSMGNILQKNLKNSSFSFYPDPYPEQQLFYRSDNATLARLGVPAHTISTSKMDVEPNYHQLSDEVKTLDLKNMTAIIKAIAISSSTIVNGEDTPTRVDTSLLR